MHALETRASSLLAALIGLGLDVMAVTLVGGITGKTTMWELVGSAIVIEGALELDITAVMVVRGIMGNTAM